MKTNHPISLYGLLSRAAPHGVASGETNITRQKETVDNDAEAFDCHVVSDRVSVVTAQPPGARSLLGV